MQIIYSVSANISKAHDWPLASFSCTSTVPKCFLKGSESFKELSPFFGFSITSLFVFLSNTNHNSYNYKTGENMVTNLMQIQGNSICIQDHEEVRC